jgi:hypothetical protein
LASTPTADRAVATPATDAPHEPGFALAAVGCPPATSMPRFWRTATIGRDRSMSLLPHSPTVVVPSAYTTNDATPAACARNCCPNARMPPTKSPVLNPPLKPATRYGRASGATCAPQAEGIGSPDPGTT